MANWLETLPKLVQVNIAFGAIVFICFFDYFTGVELSFSIFYFLPIVLVSWYMSRFDGVLFSFMCATAWALADHFGGNTYSSVAIFFFNTLVRLTIFLVVASLIAKLKQNSIKIANNKLLVQRSYDVITTSQRITHLIAKNVIEHNAKLWIWIVKQKKINQQIPPIVETTCAKIGANLASLTEICYSHQISEKNHVELEKLIAEVEERLRATDQYGIVAETPLEPYNIDHLKTEAEVNMLIKLTNEKLAL